jgi:hypothetical protein
MNKIVSTWREYYIFWAYLLASMAAIALVVFSQTLNYKPIQILFVVYLIAFAISYPIVGLTSIFSGEKRLPFVVLYLLLGLPYLCSLFISFLYFTVPVMD